MCLKEMKRLLTPNRDTPETNRDGGSGPQNRADEIRRQRQEVWPTVRVYCTVLTTANHRSFGRPPVPL